MTVFEKGVIAGVVRMNMRLHEQVHASRELPVIANHLNATPLETVTAEDGPERRVTIEVAPDNFVPVLAEQFRQQWAPAVAQAYREAETRTASLIPDLGPEGVVCVTTHRTVYLWLVSGDPIPPTLLTHRPVDADVVATGCVDSVPILSRGLNRKLLVLCYPREVGLYWLCYQDSRLRLSRSNFEAEIQDIPTTVAGGCEGRIFIGTRAGDVYEFSYGRSPFSNLALAFGARAGLSKLTWRKPNGNTAVHSLRVDSVSKTLIVLGAGGALALYSLGDGITTHAIRRASYSPSHFLGSFGAAKLLDVLPMDPEDYSFQGMCVFEDGGRLKLSMKFGDSVAWDTVNWAIDGAFRTTTKWTRSDKPIPHCPAPGSPARTISDVAPASDGTTWLVCERVGETPTLSLLQFLDAKPNRRMEGGGVYFRSQLTLSHIPLAFATHPAESRFDFTGFDRSNDFISQQCALVCTRHMVLDQEEVSVIFVKPAINVLNEILRLPIPAELNHNLMHFGKLYGSVEMAAMISMAAPECPVPRIFDRVDLFSKPRMVQRKRAAPSSPQPAESMTSNLTSFVSDQIISTEEDIEYSDGFKGFVLSLRQILKTLWWKTVMSISVDPVSQDLQAEVNPSVGGLNMTFRALTAIQTSIFNHVAPYDLRVAKEYTFPTETMQIEVSDLMALMVLIQRCREAIKLLGHFKKRSEIVSIVAGMTEPERRALNIMTFNNLVFAPKATSPFTPFLKAALNRLEMSSTGYSTTMSFLKSRVSTFWNSKDANEYEGLRKLAEEAKGSENGFHIDSQMFLLNGPTRDCRL